MNRRNEKAITLIALVVTIVVLLILAGVSIAMLSGENGIITQAQNAKENNRESEKKERIQLEVLGSYGTDGKIDIVTLKANIAKNIPEVTIGEETELPLTVTIDDDTFTIKANGTVESVATEEKPVVGDKSGANHPELEGGMIAITYNIDGSENIVSDPSKRDWYNYAKQTGLTDTYNEETGEWGTSHWANAKLNGNYYVWIPRYAYKIDTSVTYTTQNDGTSHKIDVIFLDENNKRADGTEIEGLITDYTEVNDTKNSTTNYILHPAFTFGDKTLSGIWVGKYETSGTESSPTVLPNQTATVNLSVAQMFEMAKNVLTSDTQKVELDAHLMKNIEWGAVVYLAQSQYGRNGTKISINQSSQKITGVGKAEGTNLIYESSYYSTDPTADQQYNGKIGKLSSTTGNVYGVYDMSGGVSEYVMGFYGTKANDGTVTIKYSGFSTIPDSKYYDVYTSSLANSGNIGDALYETTSWNSEYTRHVDSDSLVFLRGGDYWYSDSGIFAYNAYSGSSYRDNGFRVCISAN